MQPPVRPDSLEAQRILRRMRSPAQLMDPEKLAAIQPSRLSATRALMNRATRERWSIRCRDFLVDHRGRGTATYSIEIGTWRFSFAAFSFEPKKQGRTDRIIGQNWDMMGTLVEGDITPEELARAGDELPKLYAGRAAPNTLIWCRANRSSRSFEHTVKALAAGRQPDVELLARTCYLMRNTGLDGNGTFGTKSFLAYEKDHPLRPSLAAQMLCAYMMRTFGLDLVRSLARSGSSRAAELSPEIARYLGVGNGSALGLVLFVNNHPKLVDRWLWTREYALANAKTLVPSNDGNAMEKLRQLIEKAITFRRQDRSTYEAVAASGVIANDLERVRAALDGLLKHAPASRGPSQPLADLCLSLDGQISGEALETLHSMMIELVPALADDLVESLVLDEELVGVPEMSVRQLRRIVSDEYSWAFHLDLESERSRRYVWYKSRRSEEPRRGPRDEVNEDAVNLALDLPRQIVRLESDLSRSSQDLSVGRFLAAHPWHRFAVTRVQALAGSRYHSFHADMLSEDFTPVHITLLVNLAFHGIDKGRDYLGRWVRGVLFHGAPLPDELEAGTADQSWFCPAEPGQ